MLSDQDIRQFQVLYKNHFGNDISREEAYNKAIRLIKFIEAVCKPRT